MPDAAPAAGAAGSPAATPNAPENAQATADAAAPAAAADPHAQFKGTKHKVTLDGKDLEVDYDELKRGYTHGKAANERMRQAADLRKQADTQLAVLNAVESGNWRPLVEKVGVDKAKAFAEQFLLQYIDWEQMPEGEKKRVLAEQRAQTAEEKLKSIEDEKAAREQAAVELQAGEEIDKEIGEALRAHGKKPTPRLVARIAEAQLAHLEATKGQSRMPAGDALSRAVDGIHHDIAEYLADMPAEEAMTRLPAPLLDRLRQAFADQVLAQDPFSQGRSGQQTDVNEAPRTRRKKLTGKELFDQMEKRFGGR